MKHNNKRIFAFDPNTKGFGYIVLEGIENIIEWGVKDSLKNKNESSIGKIKSLLEFYQPDEMIVEDCSKNNRRHARVKQLITLSLKHAEKFNINTCLISNTSIKDYFKKLNCKNKHQIAQEIAKHYDVLKRILPPKRRIWMSEDSRMSIFKAVSLAWMYFYIKNEE